MRSRAELKAIAKASLAGRYGSAIGAMLISWLMSCIPFCAPSMGVGYSRFHNNVVRGEGGDAGDVFMGFSVFGKALWMWILQGIILWFLTLLLVIPGIIASFSYALCNYVLADNKHLTGKQALDASRDLMRGHRMDLFMLQLSFFGWILLAGLTAGILMLWLGPYMEATTAAFYNDLIGRPMPAANPNTYYQQQG